MCVVTLAAVDVGVTVVFCGAAVITGAAVVGLAVLGFALRVVVAAAGAPVVAVVDACGVGVTGAWVAGRINV